MPRKWNNGIVEHWNIGFQKEIMHCDVIVIPVGDATINPIIRCPRTHYSTNPVFQHSNYERSKLNC